MSSVREEVRSIYREFIAMDRGRTPRENAKFELVTRAISNYDSDEEMLEMLKTERDGYNETNRFSSAAKDILEKVDES